MGCGSSFSLMTVGPAASTASRAVHTLGIAGKMRREGPSATLWNMLVGKGMQNLRGLYSLAHSVEDRELLAKSAKDVRALWTRMWQLQRSGVKFSAVARVCMDFPHSLRLMPVVTHGSDVLRMLARQPMQSSLRQSLALQCMKQPRAYFMRLFVFVRGQSITSISDWKLHASPFEALHACVVRLMRVVLGSQAHSM